MNILKKVLVCGASLVMVASLGSGISNVSAKHIHHYHNHTSRIYNKRNRKNNRRNTQFKNLQHYLNNVKRYNSHHTKKLNTYKLRHLNKYMSYLSRSQKRQLLNEVNVISKTTYSHKKNVKRNKRAKHVANKHIKKTTKKHLTKMIHKSKKQVVHKHTESLSQKIANDYKSDTNVTDKYSINQPGDSHYISGGVDPNYTDNGRYYTFNELCNLLNTFDVYANIEPKDEANKLYWTIWHYISTPNMDIEYYNRLNKLVQYFEINDDDCPVEDALGAAQESADMFDTLH